MDVKQYNVNTNVEKPLPAWLPLVVGAVLVAQFAGLGVWQLSRGFEKLDERDAYDSASGYSNFYNGAKVRPYQAVKASGRFDAAHQFLLDNIILESRYGYYVLTPLELDENDPLLMINRGWIEKSGPTPDLAAVAGTIALDVERVTVRGRVGSLPRAGMRMGDAIPAGSDWPKVALYPTTEDLERELGRAVEPFILLMDPESEAGFVRHWVPAEMGPGRHFGYALQWFAMGVVLAGMLGWHYRKRGPWSD